MKIKTELLQAFMQKNELSAAILAREMGVTVGEVEKLLDGKAVNEETARRCSLNGFVIPPYFFHDAAADDDVLAFVEHRLAGVVVPDLFQVASDFV